MIVNFYDFWEDNNQRLSKVFGNYRSFKAWIGHNERKLGLNYKLEDIIKLRKQTSVFVDTYKKCKNVKGERKGA